MSRSRPRTIGTPRIEVKTLLTIAGIILLLAGLVWMGQGSGYFPYPAESFMIGEKQWIYYGGVTAAIGFVLIFFAQRWRGPP